MLKISKTYFASEKSKTQIKPEYHPVAFITFLSVLKCGIIITIKKNEEVQVKNKLSE